jgi:GAF domain-containing protein
MKRSSTVAEKREGRDFFDIFCRVSETLASSHVEKEVLSLIVTSAAQALGGKGSTLMLLDPGTGELEIIASTGLSKEYLDKGAVKAEKSVADAMKGKPVVIADATMDSRVQYPQAARKEGISSILVVPMKLRETVMGALRIYFSEPREFTQQEVAFTGALAVQGALALENARLFHTMEEHYRIFRQVGKSINSTLKFEDVLGALVRDVAEALDVKGVALRLLDREKQRLEVAASYGLSKEYISKGPVEATSSIPETMLGKTVCIEDTSCDTRLQYSDWAKKEGICSILSVPVKAKEKIIGVLRLYSDCVRRFTEAEITLAEALAEQGGIAVENALLYSRVKEDYEDLRDNLWSHRSWF